LLGLVPAWMVEIVLLGVWDKLVMHHLQAALELAEGDLPVGIMIKLIPECLYLIVGQ
jgi:hypothetical protein